MVVKKFTVEIEYMPVDFDEGDSVKKEEIFKVIDKMLHTLALDMNIRDYNYIKVKEVPKWC